MNAVFNLSALMRLCAAIAAFSMLAACGQRGPLYLPKGETSAMISKPATPVTTPDSTDSSATTPATPKKDANDASSNNQKN